MSLEALPLIGILAAGALYGLGVQNLAGRDRHWPWYRATCFALGLLVIAIATQTRLAAEDTRLFSAHMVQHLLLSLIAPPLLCLGAPITLFLQASRRQWQQ